MINLEYYRVFFYVARCKSFTKAAEVLHNAQPNITRYINLLEHDLGCRLFVRSNRGVTLTPEGEGLYEQVSLAMEHISLGENRILQSQNADSGLISVGVTETALQLYVLPRLEKFHQQNPDVRLKLSHLTSPDVIASLKNSLVEMGVITSPVEIEKPLKKKSLGCFREILIGGSGFRYLQDHPLSLQELSHLPLISLEKNSGTRQFYTNLFLQNGLLFNPDMEIATIDQMLPMIEHNLGIGFFPEKMAEDSIRLGKVFALPLQKKIPLREILLVTEQQRPLSAISKQLVACMKDQAIS